MGWLTVVVAADSERRQAELVQALAALPLDVVPAEESAGPPASSHGGVESLEQAASRRAVEICQSTGLLAIVEASGLEVDALGGRPEHRAGRLAGERVTDAEKNAALLGALEEIDDDGRSARYRCVIAVASPWMDAPVTVQAHLEGTIARASRGGGGVAYEPLFVVEGESCSLAELTDERRQKVSPHGAAARSLVPVLVGLLNDMLDGVQRMAGRADS
jgi:XTP/dITP diphosphohydrolase